MYNEQESQEDVQPRPQPPVADEPAAPLSEQLGFGVGTLLAAGALDMFAHFGLTGLVVGGIAAYVASQHGPELLQQVKGAGLARPAPMPVQPVPRPVSLEQVGRNNSKRSVLDRVLGRFPAVEEVASLEEEENIDTVLVEEPQAEDFSPAARRAFQPSVIPQVLRHPIVLSPDLVVEANDIVAAGINIFGVKGSGKTASAVARLAEQFARYRVCEVLFDIKGDLLPLVTDRRPSDGRPYVPNGYIGKRGHVPRGRSVLQCGLQAVYDLRMFQTPEQMASLICFIVEELLETVALLPEGSLAPCLVFLDEAEYWLPQEQPSYLSGHTYKRLLDAFHLLATMGRSRGLAPVIATQRIAKVNKDIIAQAEMNIFMKATLDNDLRRYREYFNKALVSDERVRGFAAGEAVVCLPDGRQVLTRLSERVSRHLSHSPHVTASLTKFAGAGRHSPLPVELDGNEEEADMPAAAIPSADQSIRRVTLPPLQPARCEPVIPESQPAAPPLPLRSRPKTELERVLDAYRDNPLASYRELGEKVGMGKDKVGDLLKEGRERGLLDQP